MTGGAFLSGEGPGEAVGLKTVSRYNKDGWMEDLGDLNIGRWGHGCTQFTNNNGAKVRNWNCPKTAGSIHKLVFRPILCVEEPQMDDKG